MAGRVSTYGYDSAGNLTTITQGVGTTTQITTTFGYDDNHQLISVTNPRGKTSHINYQYLDTWNTSGSTEGWARNLPAATSTSQSILQAHTGSGALSVSLSSATVSNQGSVVHTYATPTALGSIPQELTVWAFVHVGTVQGFLRVNYGTTPRDASATDGTPVTLTNNQWTALRIPTALLDPGSPVQSLEVVFQAPSGFAGLSAARSTSTTCLCAARPRR